MEEHQQARAERETDGSSKPLFKKVALESKAMRPAARPNRLAILLYLNGFSEDFGYLRVWPKTLCDFALLEVRFAGIFA